MSQVNGADADWFIARCLHGTDKHAIAVLKRYQVPTYYPKIVELKPVALRHLSHSQRISGVTMQRPVQSPLFPRYVLIQVHAVTLNFDLVFEEAGIGGFAFKGERIARLTAAEVGRIRAHEGGGGLIDGKKSLRVVFGIGEEVTITDGPFASFPGVVEHGLDVAIGDLDPTTRLKVAVDIFGRQTPVELELYQVAKHR